MFDADDTADSTVLATTVTAFLTALTTALAPDPSYKMSWEPVIGAGLVVICTVGIIAVAADDLTGVGVADDFLFGPLGAGVGEGLIMIFG